MPIQDYSRMFSSLALNDSGCGASTTSPGRLFHRLIDFAVREDFPDMQPEFYFVPLHASSSCYKCITPPLVICLPVLVFMTFKYFEMASKSTLGWILGSIIHHCCHL